MLRRVARGDAWAIADEGIPWAACGEGSWRFRAGGYRIGLRKGEDGRHAVEYAFTPDGRFLPLDDPGDDPLTLLERDALEAFWRAIRAVGEGRP